MTFSILAFDEKSGTYGGAAATGSLCVGGWVLRGDPLSGLSASQGTAPSTLWGTAVLDAMRGGEPAAQAVARITGADPGAPYRQLAALDPGGGTGAHTGKASIPEALSTTGRHAVAAGNMLADRGVPAAILNAFLGADGTMAERLLAALRAGQRQGGDSRGLKSAALLVVARDIAPLTLRVDFSDDPLDTLTALHASSQSEPYRSWTREVPTIDAPYRAPTPESVPAEGDPAVPI